MTLVVFRGQSVTGISQAKLPNPDRRATIELNAFLAWLDKLVGSGIKYM